MEDKAPTVPTSNATSNGSLSPGPVTASWGFLAICVSIIFIMVIILNSLTLFLFIKNRRLRSPFSTYLMCLLGLNILYAVLQNPLDIMNNLYPYWPANFQWCSVYIYALYILQAATMHIHLLITCNRAWAVTFPISHRRLHSHKWHPVLCCSIAWLYVHTILLPGFIGDALWYRTLDEVCRVVWTCRNHEKNAI